MRMMGKWEWLENDKVGAGQTNVQPETYHFWLKENLEMRMDEKMKENENDGKMLVQTRPPSPARDLLLLRPNGDPGVPNPLCHQ